ncbi:MAG TPA: peptidase M20, partial [Pirellulales bacterium]|nr:peptidase M20 [Pirellulales bacterium]
MDNLDAYLEQNRERFERELCELIRIPSVSADTTHRKDVRKAAEWVAAQLEALGLNPEIAPTA